MADVTLRLREVRTEALDTLSFLFAAEGLSGALPGQYLLVKVDAEDDPRRGSRSFTMANSPTEDHVMITTRIRSGSVVKKKLVSLRPGDALAAKGPLGKFTLPEGAAPAVFLAGGIGVTPFRSMIKAAIDTGRRAPMTLVTSDRLPEAIPFREEVDRWGAANRWLTIARTVTRPTAGPRAWEGRVGRIDAAWIRDLGIDSSQGFVYIAGAPGFVDAMATVAASLGVPPERVKLERFLGY